MSEPIRVAGMPLIINTAENFYKMLNVLFTREPPPSLPKQFAAHTAYTGDCYRQLKQAAKDYLVIELKAVNSRPTYRFRDEEYTTLMRRKIQCRIDMDGTLYITNPQGKRVIVFLPGQD